MRNVLRAESNENLDSGFETDMGGMLNTPGFMEFLDKFDDFDVDNMQFDERDGDFIKERFEIFQVLPRIKETYIACIKEKVIADLDVNAQEPLLKNVEAELDKRVFGNRDFEFIRSLEAAVEKTRTLPLEISALEADLESRGSRRELAKANAGVEAGISRKKIDIAEGQNAEAGVKAAGEFIKHIDGAEGQILAAEKFCVERVGKLLGGLEQIFSLTKGHQDKILNLLARLPDLGRLKMPDLNSAESELGILKQAKKDKDPLAYLEGAAVSSISLILEQIRQGQFDVCQHAINQLGNIASGKDAKQNYPQLDQWMQEIGDIQKLLDKGEQAGEMRHKVERAAADYKIYVQARKGLEELKKDPANVDLYLNIAASIDSLLDSQAAVGLQRELSLLAASQSTLVNGATTELQVEEAAAYSKKGWFAKVILRPWNRSPEHNAAGKVRDAKRELAGLEREKQFIGAEIRSYDQLERQIRRKEISYKAARENLFLSLDSVKAVFRQARSDKESMINKQLDSTDLRENFGASADVEHLRNARIAEPELYGRWFQNETDDGDDENETTMHGGRTLRQLEKDFLNILEEKVSKAMARALENLASAEITPDNLAVKILAFENTLGRFSQDERYVQIKKESLRFLAGPGSPLPRMKKAAIKFMLKQAEKVGGFNFAFAI